MGSLKWLAITCALGSAAAAQAENGSALAPYTLEFAPTLGTNLPYDLWGPPGTLSYVGLRSLYNLQPLTVLGALSASFLYQHSGANRGYTGDIGWNYDFVQQGLNGFFNVGFHYTVFKFTPNRASDGTCTPASCATDSGTHTGFFFGGGLIVPMSPKMPIRFGMRFYNGPCLQLLLDMAAGLRF